jgi:uncharacterized repeat protein (TIGR03803 family)
MSKATFVITHCALFITSFMLATTSAFASEETVLASLDTNRGTRPSAELVFDAAGNLDGTTPAGGTRGFGTVFQLQPISGGGWKTVVVHNFGNGTDGRTPEASLVLGPDGNLYGVTIQGGGGSSCNCGTVFELSASGGSWSERVIHSFAGGSDGSFPSGGLVFDSDGNLYGVTSGGGSASNGTVFELTPGGDSWTESVIFTFGTTTGFTGQSPQCALAIDASGNLYGTTLAGGYGLGVVFELSRDSGDWKEKVIFRFLKSSTKTGVVFDNAGNLYGVTVNGGRDGFGAVFELTPSGDTWTKKDIHEFSNRGDGGQPVARLLFANGNLYGTTPGGGQSGLGVVFELTPESGEWHEIVLHPFRPGDDAAEPYAGVIVDNAGNLYGTTMFGGRHGNGAVYEVTP